MIGMLGKLGVDGKLGKFQTMCGTINTIFR